MKVILSRKGFDSQYGGIPSPIFPDGSLASMPIPSLSSQGSRHRYSKLRLPSGETYAEFLEDLGFADLAQAHCHLDPDINSAAINRKDWRPAFGQAGAAAKHLSNQNIGAGDLFLFFGWFRRVQRVKGKWRFDRQDPGGHLVYGYLQVEAAIPVNLATDLPPWLSDHPHSQQPLRQLPNNTIYTARQQLSLSSAQPGAGCIGFDPKLVLTSEGQTRGRWALPDFFRDLKITYHQPGSWKDNYFQAASRGQEFVVQDDDRVSSWAQELIIPRPADI